MYIYIYIWYLYLYMYDTHVIYIYTYSYRMGAPRKRSVEIQVAELTLVYVRYDELVNGVYKATFNYGHHPVHMHIYIHIYIYIHIIVITCTYRYGTFTTSFVVSEESSTKIQCESASRPGSGLCHLGVGRMELLQQGGICGGNTNRDFLGDLGVSTVMRVPQVRYLVFFKFSPWEIPIENGWCLRVPIVIQGLTHRIDVWYIC